MTDRQVFGPAKDGNFVEFMEKELYNEAESNDKGRPIYYTQHWVRIISPGDKLTIPEFLMDDIRKEKYGPQYKEWLDKMKKGDTGASGTPLTAWPLIDRARATGLKAQGIYSVEMLASITDAHIGQFGPGIVQLREQAKNFLKAAAGAAPISKLTADLQHANDQIAALRQQIETMAAQQGAAPAAAVGAPAAPPPVDVQALVAAEVAKLLGGQPQPAKTRRAPKAKQPAPAAAAAQ